MDKEKIAKLVRFKQDKDFAIFSELLEIAKELKKKIEGDTEREIEVEIDRSSLIKGDTGPMGPEGPRGQSIAGPEGPRGPVGPRGESIVGPAGKNGKSIIGPRGLKGKDGKIGPQGNSPKHQWMGTSLRFQEPNGEWGKWVDLKGSVGSFSLGGGAGSVDKLTAGANITLVSDGVGGYIISTNAGLNASVEKVTAVTSGDNVTIDLTQLAHAYTAVLLVTRQGQAITPGAISGDISSWEKVGDIITVYNASSSEDFLIQYAY